MPTQPSFARPAPRVTRRRFLQYSSAALAVAGPFILRGQNLNSRIHIAAIGAGGKGRSDTDSVAVGNDIVALCDIDEGVLRTRMKLFPRAKTYHDYRLMLEEVKEIDAVTVSTPDHHHAPASIMAMKLGKHVYCQKPLTHSVHEARMMRQVAAQSKVATQMGNQGSAETGLRRAVEVIQSGALGPVRQVHVWSNRPIWPQGIDRPKDTPPVDPDVYWDLFLGPAPERPYHPAYHPINWRGWVDFGTGALGDMACHTANMPFHALQLGHPTSIEARSSGMNGETYPKDSTIQFEFPARNNMPPVTLFWYDGGNKPHPDITEKVLAFVTKTDPKKKLPGSGCLVIGDQGQLFSPDDYGASYALLPENQFTDYKGPEPTIPRSPGHYREWLDAIKGGPTPFSNFDVAATLTEIILLGCVALRAGEKILWDGAKMKATNLPAAAPLIRRDYRPGWTL